MRVPSWILVTAAVVVAFPFGWGLGVLVAYLIAGKSFGQLPALTCRPDRRRDHFRAIANVHAGPTAHDHARRNMRVPHPRERAVADRSADELAIIPR